jgi:hypothetical protein
MIPATHTYSKTDPVIGLLLTYAYTVECTGVSAWATSEISPGCSCRHQRAQSERWQHKKRKAYMKKTTRTNKKSTDVDCLTILKRFFKDQHLKVIDEGHNTYKVEGAVAGKVKADFRFYDLQEIDSIEFEVAGTQTHPAETIGSLFHLVNHFNEVHGPTKFTINGNGTLDLTVSLPKPIVRCMDIRKSVDNLVGIYEVGATKADKVANGMGVDKVFPASPGEYKAKKGDH